ncbi:MAG: hypothetical protein R2771_14120 [Saprospiraceae bacterium]
MEEEIKRNWKLLNKQEAYIKIGDILITEEYFNAKNLEICDGQSICYTKISLKDFLEPFINHLNTQYS